MPSKSINELDIVSSVDSANAYIIVETSSGTKRISLDSLINSSNAVDTKPATAHGTFNASTGGTIRLNDAFASNSSTTVVISKDGRVGSGSFNKLSYDGVSVNLIKPAGSSVVYAGSTTFPVGSEGQIPLGFVFGRVSSGKYSSSGLIGYHIIAQVDTNSITIKPPTATALKGCQDQITVIAQTFK